MHALYFLVGPPYELPKAIQTSKSLYLSADFDDGGDEDEDEIEDDEKP